MADNYEVGDTVGIRIAKVDRTNTSKKILPCKILRKNNDRFVLYSTSGILNTTFSFIDLVDFRNVKFDDLESTDPSSLTTIAYTRASRDVTGF